MQKKILRNVRNNILNIAIHIHMYIHSTYNIIFPFVH